MTQYLLLTFKFYTISYYPYYLLPLGGIFTYFYYRRKYRRSKTGRNTINKILASMGIVFGINFTILGFVYWRQLGDSLFPIFCIFLAIWLLVTGVAIRLRLFIFGSIFLNIIGFVLFYVNNGQQQPVYSLAIAISVIIPGIILRNNYRKENV